MSDLRQEDLQPFRKIAAQLPSRPNVCTLHRWRGRGIRGKRLESLLIGGVWYTSIDACHRMFMTVTSAADTMRASPNTGVEPTAYGTTPTSTASASVSAKALDAELRAKGL